jgi:proline iminopeptidase
MEVQVLIINTFWMDSCHWQKIKLIFYDQRGCGQSTKELDSTTVSLDLFIEDIEALRKEFNIEKLNLLAHSWGGLLAMKYAIKYPENLSKLVLSSSVGASTEIDAMASEAMAQKFTEEDNAQRMAIFQSEAFKNREIGAIESLMKLGFKQQFHNSDLVDSLKLSLNADYMKTNQLLQYLGKDLSKYDFHSDLKTLTIPTLLIYGSEDVLLDFSGKKLYETIPNSSLQIINESGHFPFIEKPKKFEKLVKSFLEYN